MASIDDPEITPRRFKRVEYEQLTEMGIFQPGERLQLLDGLLYARARVTDYWIVSLVDNLVEIYREPVASDSAPYGWRYASVVYARPTDVIMPLAAPHARSAVADLLP